MFSLVSIWRSKAISLYLYEGHEVFKLVFARSKRATFSVMVQELTFPKEHEVVGFLDFGSEISNGYATGPGIQCY